MKLPPDQGLPRSAAETLHAAGVDSIHTAERPTSDEPDREPPLGHLAGIWGRPYLDLERYLDLSPLPAIDDEICLALTRVPLDYTGGSHKWMGIVPPSLASEPYIDYGQVIDGFSDEEFLAFAALADDPTGYDVAHRRNYEFGEERDHALNRRQMLYLKFKYGVYFPWKVYYEMIPNLKWEEKSSGAGKDFTREARRYFPKLIDWVRHLPFIEIGRCNIMGLESNDHGTVHRDGDPAEKTWVDHFITLSPRGNKRVFLWDEAEQRRTFLRPRAYWFNDSDYHGVAADPFFRYSIRIDGIFTKAFRERLERDHPRR